MVCFFHKYNTTRGYFWRQFISFFFISITPPVVLKAVYLSFFIGIVTCQLSMIDSKSMWHNIYQESLDSFNPLQPDVAFLYPLRGYRKATPGRNGLRHVNMKLKKMNGKKLTILQKKRTPLKVSIENTLIPKKYFMKCFFSFQSFKHSIRLISNVLFIRNLT